MLARRAKSGPRDGGYAGIFQQDSANVFGRDTCSANVDPGIEGALGRLAAESWDLIQAMDELLAAAGELGNHAWRSALTIAKGVDGGVLNEFVDAGVGVDGHHQQGGHDVGGRDGVALLGAGRFAYSRINAATEVDIQ